VANEDPVQELRDLAHKRFIELATDLKPKTRQALKSLFDGVFDQLAFLREAVAVKKGPQAAPPKAKPAKAKPAKKRK
jgi:hypothetical protein